MTVTGGDGRGEVDSTRRFRAGGGRRRLLIAILAVAAAGAAIVAERAAPDVPALGDATASAAGTDANLDAIGPVQLITAAYGHTLYVECLSDILEDSIGAGDLVGVGAATIVGATFEPNTPLWVPFQGQVVAGVASFGWQLLSVIECDNPSASPAGAVILHLSTGDDYTVTVVPDVSTT